MMNEPITDTASESPVVTMSTSVASQLSTNSTSDAQTQHINTTEKSVSDVTHPTETSQHSETNVTSDRAVKRKYVVLFGYVGTGYAGMQRNPGVRALEDVMEEALAKAGYIEETNIGVLGKIDWSRAARTDKGVHAAGQVVAARLRIPEEDVEAARIELNKFMPEHVEVLALHRVTKRFNAKNFCHLRQYEYLLPTFAFRKPIQPILVNKPYIKVAGQEPVETLHYSSKDPYSTGSAYQIARQQTWKSFQPLPDCWLSKTLDNNQKLVFSVAPPSNNIFKHGTDTIDSYQTGEAYAKGRQEQWDCVQKYEQESLQDVLMNRQEKFRLGSRSWETLHANCKKYIGTHNFHNFTPRFTFGDASCSRTIHEFDVSKPFLVDDVEYVRFTIRGQSFMLNQIRHMIGLLVDLNRGVAPPRAIEIAFAPVKMRVPLAPATGLFLHHCEFDVYNRNRTQDHEPIHFGEETAAGQRLREFKEKHIWMHIHEQIIQEKPFEAFIEELNAHPFSYKSYRPDVDMDAKGVTHVSKAAREKFEHRKRRREGADRRSRFGFKRGRGNRGRPRM